MSGGRLVLCCGGQCGGNMVAAGVMCLLRGIGRIKPRRTGCAAAGAMVWKIFEVAGRIASCEAGLGEREARWFGCSAGGAVLQQCGVAAVKAKPLRDELCVDEAT